MNENAGIFEIPIVKAFVKKRKNRNLIYSFLTNPSQETEVALDKAFRDFYFNARFLSYISKTLHFHAINFDKRVRKQQCLSLNQTVEHAGSVELIELIPDPRSVCAFERAQGEQIESHLDNLHLAQAVSQLSMKQKQILFMYYVKGYNDSEIAKVLGVSQQAVSKMHKKCLLFLKHAMNEVRESG
ncbi:sigma-70 family RNA polymerase sigma factor [Brevibacillus ruminantium]|uniref:Sigma-70 family RNA polymerase sigma factor n=1 Tax=Brevibacillus ruminantium TaxID=2950604 RepID=A0ABY4WCR3_9BACL|nr:sigma-70 family RNA polymerase sigma factor [Brevibacillus ruminantium]USG64970.1 sigma-70 family RNA polymerase sigma factor [Brevibacillus ruminantium]